MLMTKLAAFWQEFLKAIMKSRYVVIHTFSLEEQKELKEKQFQKFCVLIIKATDFDALVHLLDVCAYFLIFAVFGT